MKDKTPMETPLSMALAEVGRPQATPMGVFKLARKYWLEGRRIGIADLAKDVGVSRVTLYRWVGSKEMLIQEVLWSFAKPTLERAIDATPGSGIDHIIGVHRSVLIAMAKFEPMRRFIIDNPTSAWRIQTNDIKTCHGRHIRAVEAHLMDQQALGHIRLPLPALKLAETIVYTNTALLYSAIIGNHSLSVIELACAIDRMILMGNIPEDPTVLNTFGTP